MPESRTTAQRLQLAAVNLVGAIIMAFIAWKAAAWALEFIAVAQDAGGSPRTQRRFATIPVAVFIVAGFAALLSLATLANAVYLGLHRKD